MSHPRSTNFIDHSRKFSVLKAMAIHLVCQVELEASPHSGMIRSELFVVFHLLQLLFHLVSNPFGNASSIAQRTSPGLLSTSNVVIFFLLIHPMGLAQALCLMIIACAVLPVCRAHALFTVHSLPRPLAGALSLDFRMVAPITSAKWMRILMRNLGHVVRNSNH
jgi:hypothetical protein